MTFLDLLYSEASNNGYTGSLQQLATAAGTAMVSNAGCVTVMTNLHTFVSAHGYTKNATDWENGCWTFFGSRPNDR